MVRVQHAEKELRMQVIDSSVALQLKGDTRITGLNYADMAEKIMAGEKGKGGGFFGGSDKLTPTSLRSIYGVIMNINAEIDSEDDFEKHKSDLQYLKVRMAYEAGRKASIRKFLKATGLDAAISSIKSYEQFLLYCRYSESLIAYFKFYGERD